MKEKTMVNMQNMPARDILIAIKLDMMNNYLTLDKYAEHNGLLPIEAARLLDLANSVISHEHPEA